MSRRRTRRRPRLNGHLSDLMLAEAAADGKRAYIEVLTEKYARLHAEAYAHQASPPLNMPCYSGILRERIRAAVSDLDSLDEIQATARAIASEMRRDPVQMTASATLTEQLFMLSAFRSGPPANSPEVQFFRNAATRLAEALVTGEHVADAAIRMLREDDELYEAVKRQILGLLPDRESFAVPYATLLRMSAIPEPLCRVALHLLLGTGAIRTCPTVRPTEIQTNSFWRTRRSDDSGESTT